MVDHIVKAASILSQPNLEEETIKRINRYVREEIDRIQPPQKTVQTVTVDPFSNMAEAVDNQYGPGVYGEWVHGAKEGDKK